MNIYMKLQNARIQLQEVDLKKSGENKFAKYDYFELGDFLPTVNKLLFENGLCSIVSFTNEMATLKMFEFEGDGVIEFTSPMATAELKGCHAIQNLGAVETYQRRYLYMTALEIVEHDALDGQPKGDTEEEKAKKEAEIISKKNIDSTKIQTIKKLLAETKSNEQDFCKFIKVEKLELITNEMFLTAMNLLKKKKDELNKTKKDLDI
jgi:hypothetical protein